MVLNKYGDIIKGQWLKQQYKYIKLNGSAIIIMPNHFHGILIIAGAGCGLPQKKRIKIEQF